MKRSTVLCLPLRLVFLAQHLSYLVVIGVEGPDEFSFILGVAGVVVEELAGGHREGHGQGHEPKKVARHRSATK
jgi:hypothetical protein